MAGHWLGNFRLFKCGVCISKSNCLGICNRSCCSSAERVTWEVNFFMAGLASLILVKTFCVVVLYTNSLKVLCITNPTGPGRWKLLTESVMGKYHQFQHLITHWTFQWICQCLSHLLYLDVFFPHLIWESKYASNADIYIKSMTTTRVMMVVTVMATIYQASSIDQTLGQMPCVHQWVPIPDCIWEPPGAIRQQNYAGVPPHIN